MRKASGRRRVPCTDRKRRSSRRKSAPRCKERVRELAAPADGADGERAVLEKIGEMSEPDRAMAERLHAIVKATAPELSARTWYGMPAYAKAGKVICFFQAATKFKSRYATLGFVDSAHLDEGEMWPTAFALQALTPSEEVKIADLIRKALRSPGGTERTNTVVPPGSRRM
jgi:uncharacterized protein YdhG (YjbR/CyaY superfamily)